MSDQKDLTIGFIGSGVIASAIMVSGEQCAVLRLNLCLFQPIPGDHGKK
jgi:hypothetical protein